MTKYKLQIKYNSLIIKYLHIFLGILLFASACGSADSDSKAQGKALAKVKEIVLYERDLLGLVPMGASPADSAEIVSRYINAWIRKQLLLAKAKTEVKIDEAEIERKLLDYRYDLIAFAFEKAYIQKNLDTKVSEAEIKKYYQENPANFELKQNIVKANLIKVSTNLPEKDSLKFFLQTKNPKLKEFCVKYAEQYALNDTTWLDLETLIKNTPFRQITNKIDFLQQNTFAETTEGKSIYYLAIREFKISNQTSPLEFVRNRIVNMLINQRKVQLAKDLEKKIFEEAKNNKEFAIFK
jgi:hypothetical protein